MRQAQHHVIHRTIWRSRIGRLRLIAKSKNPTILLSRKQFFTPHFKMGER